MNTILRLVLSVSLSKNFTHGRKQELVATRNTLTTSMLFASSQVERDLGDDDQLLSRYCTLLTVAGKSFLPPEAL